MKENEHREPTPEELISEYAREMGIMYGLSPVLTEHLRGYGHMLYRSNQIKIATQPEALANLDFKLPNQSMKEKGVRNTKDVLDGLIRGFERIYFDWETDKNASAASLKMRNRIEEILPRLEN